MNSRFLSTVLFSCFLIGILSCIKESDDTEYPHLEKEIEIGDRVPDFTIYEKTDNTGTIFSSSQFAGKQSLLLFFNTGCQDCQREMPKINYVYEAVKNDPSYQVITIARDQGENEIQQYWAQQGFTMPAFVDPGRKVYTLFANQTVPRLYIIDTTGTIVWMAVEKITLSQEELLELVKEIG